MKCYETNIYKTFIKPLNVALIAVSIEIMFIFIDGFYCRCTMHRVQDGCASTRYLYSSLDAKGGTIFVLRFSYGLGKIKFYLIERKKINYGTETSRPVHKQQNEGKIKQTIIIIYLWITLLGRWNGFTIRFLLRALLIHTILALDSFGELGMDEGYNDYSHTVYYMSYVNLEWNQQLIRFLVGDFTSFFFLFNII